MEKTFFKRFMKVTLAAVMLIGCTLALTGCGKQETGTVQEETKETLIETVWIADYIVTDNFGKLTMEEVIEQGFQEEDTSYVLEFVDEDGCFLRMLHGNRISFEDELSYTFQSGNLSFADSNITEASYSSTDGITITHLTGDEEATFHFVRDDTAARNVEISNTADPSQTE